MKNGCDIPDDMAETARRDSRDWMGDVSVGREVTAPAGVGLAGDPGVTLTEKVALDTKPHFLCSPTKRPSGLKYEKAREWRIPCVNAQWLGDILLGDFEALRQVQCSRYAAFGLPDPFAPTQRLVWSLLGEWACAALVPGPCD